MSELAIRGLAKSFGRTQAVSGLDLTVPAGALAAVLGPSGCGKTTLLRLIAGFERPDAGTVALDGRVVAGRGVMVAPERRRVGVVPQEGALFPHLTVGRNVGFGLGRAAKESGRVDEVLELVGLAGYANRMPAELSGGQQQRVALARALAPEPALVLLDEPFSALDTSLRASVREEVRRALEAAGATAVLVTHDQQEALSVADLVAVMRAGQVVQVAAPADLYHAPVDLHVARFLGDVIEIPAEAANGRVRTVLGEIAIRASSFPGHPRGSAGTAVLRPEQIEIHSAQAPGGGAVPARVTGTVFYGHDALVQLELSASGPTPVRVTARTLHPFTLPSAATVWVRVVGDVLFYP
jgi:iron(III) transport system ATP-binding protein